MNDARKEMSVFLERQTVKRRQDWTAKLRRVERILLSFAIVFAGLAALYGLYQMVFLGSTFKVRRIVVEGDWRYLTADGLARLSGVEEGDDLFCINVSKVHERLLEEPWIAATAVHRRLPNTLWIYAEEHKPAALLVSDNGLVYVDKDGAPFKSVELNDDRDLPLLTGLSYPKDDSEEFKDGAHVREMLYLAELFRLSKAGKERGISEVNYDRKNGYSIITMSGRSGPPFQIVFGRENLSERVAGLDLMIDAVQARAGRIQYMLANETGRITVGALVR